MFVNNVDARITSRAVNHGEWYQDVIRAAGLASYSEVPGCMIIEPHGSALWKRIRDVLGARIEATGHHDMMFPTLIPYSFFKREAAHIDGFAPELAMIEKLRGKSLADPLVLRPTSETIIYRYFADRIRSKADLPVLINQWANVFRVEKRTVPFLRSMEFHWQEGHTAHASASEAQAETRKMLEVYRAFVQDVLAIPCISGKKTPLERFAGAIETYTIESFMQTGKALQCATSHYLGSDFAGAFGVSFIGSSNESQPVHTTSWGMSTRIIGALVMTHADDRGMIMPPRIAPVQIAILSAGNASASNDATGVATEVFNRLSATGFRVTIDSSGESLGRQQFAWEKRGVPLRLTIGMREAASRTVSATRRDTGERTTVAIDGLEATISDLLNQQHHHLFGQAAVRMAERTCKVDTLGDLEAGIANGAGLFTAGWAGTDDDEIKLKEQFELTIRCIPDKPTSVSPCCFMTGRAAREQVLIGKSY